MPKATKKAKGRPPTLTQQVEDCERPSVKLYENAMASVNNALNKKYIKKPVLSKRNQVDKFENAQPLPPWNPEPCPQMNDVNQAQLIKLCSEVCSWDNLDFDG